MREYASQSKTSDKRPVIWTPRFVVFFAITLVSGLSAESLLTEEWQNNHYSMSLILAGHLFILLIALMLLTRYTHSLWMRFGTVLGYLWTLFTLVSVFLPINGPFSLIRADSLAAASSALLSFSICLSTNRTRIRRWDTIVFWLAPPVAALTLMVYIRLHPVSYGHIKGAVEATTTILLALSCVLWWLRPSCWHTQPCPTFLFGLAPLLAIFVIYWEGDGIGTRVFLSQLLLLCLLLGIIRIIQAEQQIQHLSSTDTDKNMLFFAPHLTNETPHHNQNQHDPDRVVEQVQQYARPE